MIELDKKSGFVTIGDVVITPSWTVDDLEQLRRNSEVILMIKTAGFMTYRVPDLADGELALLIIFKDERLIRLSIGVGIKNAYPPFEITHKKRIITKEWLKSMGGESDYSWGKVRYEEDLKSGSAGIEVIFQV